ncbi:MAG: patatin-like phospholipase family protein, partial [Nitrospira sp.]|nr:patatin-like phospholipase family protein [Nitrospira sp.]
MKALKITSPFLGAFCLLIAGCMTVAIHGDDQQVKGGFYQGAPEITQARIKERGEENVKLWEKSYANERDYYLNPTNDGGKTYPRVCLSLSGGGIRSAAFSIGVMKGLHAIAGRDGAPFLHQIDILSGVSGGSYALTWYYVNQLPPQPIDRDALFAEQAQKHLRENADFIAPFTIGIAALGDAGLIPLNLFANGVFGWHWDTSFLATTVYELAIQKTFHGGRNATFPELNTLIKKQRLPFFVIGTTARIDDDRFHHAALLSKSIFEFTPLGFGSDALGHSKPTNQFPRSVPEVVEISGAAWDSSQSLTGTSQKVIGSTLNQDTGRYLNNNQVDRSFFESLGYRVSPFPFYFFNRAYTMDLYGESIYLSDGGHSENLAAFPLVRRLCENIILVDAEYDPNYAFEAYFKLKEALGRELSVSTKLDPQPANLNLKGSIDDIDTVIEKQRTIKNVDKSDWIEPITKQYFSRRQPVMSGTISTIPLTFSSNVIRKDLKLTYIKLALDEEEFRNKQIDLNAKYGKEVVTYYESVLNGTCELRPRVFAWLKDCAFPHYATTYQNYAESQFAAYVKLGECTVLNHLDYDALRQSVAVRVTPRN